MNKENLIDNPHPELILNEEFLQEIGVSQNKLAEKIGVPSNRIHAIVKGIHNITADTDLRLSKFFGLSEGYWLRQQSAYDILEAKRKYKSIVQDTSLYESEDSVIK